MIVSSLLLLVIAVGLLLTGMATGNDQLLVASIAASALAGVALYAGVRVRGTKRPRFARGGPVRQRSVQDDDTQQFRRIGLDDTPTTELPLLEGKVFEATDYEVDRDPELRFEEAAARKGTHRAPEALADEPAAQRLTAVEASALMRLDTEVAVVDGRPRFHHTACTHLSGRDHEPIPVSEALELGFSPCARCEPVSRLLMAPAVR